MVRHKAQTLGIRVLYDMRGLGVPASVTGRVISTKFQSLKIPNSNEGRETEEVNYSSFLSNIYTLTIIKISVEYQVFSSAECIPQK